MPKHRTKLEWKPLICVWLREHGVGWSFKLKDIYAQAKRLGKSHPTNKHVPEKLRQALQELIVERIIVRLERGLYQVIALPITGPLLLHDGPITVKAIKELERLAALNGCGLTAVALGHAAVMLDCETSTDASTGALQWHKRHALP